MFSKRLYSEKNVALSVLIGLMAFSSGCRSKPPALETLNADELT
jgi:hypothetical protein